MEGIKKYVKDIFSNSGDSNPQDSNDNNLESWLGELKDTASKATENVEALSKAVCDNITKEKWSAAYDTVGGLTEKLTDLLTKIEAAKKILDNESSGNPPKRSPGAGFFGRKVNEDTIKAWSSEFGDSKGPTSGNIPSTPPKTSPKESY